MVNELKHFRYFIFASEVKVYLGGHRSVFWKSCTINEKYHWKGLIKISMVHKLEPYKDFILASEVKVDLEGQRSFLENAAQFNEKHLWKGLMNISRMVFELKPFEILFCPSGSKLTLEVKGHFLKKLCNSMENIVEKVWWRYLQWCTN